MMAAVLKTLDDFPDLNPLLFGKQLEALAALAGLFTVDTKTGERIPDRRNARTVLRALERLGLIVIHDVGFPGTEGRGRCALYGIVPPGMTPEQVREEVKEHSRIKGRLRMRSDEVGLKRRSRTERPGTEKRAPEKPATVTPIAGGVVEPNTAPPDPSVVVAAEQIVADAKAKAAEAEIEAVELLIADAVASAAEVELCFSG